MHTIDLPAGASVRFIATARGDRDLHRWDLKVFSMQGGLARLIFGSLIGGRDLHQSLDIPAQDVDCRVEVQARHETLNGWVDNRAWRGADTPERLLIGYCNPSLPGARRDDLMLSFAFDHAGAPA